MDDARTNPENGDKKIVQNQLVTDNSLKPLPLRNIKFPFKMPIVESGFLGAYQPYFDIAPLPIKFLFIRSLI